MEIITGRGTPSRLEGRPLWRPIPLALALTIDERAARGDGALVRIRSGLK